ncbi:Cellular retinaldehyde binding/alpha-tocopherol transport,CRAL/TRIO, N-terminal domain,CRAL-TRIO lipid [Cinara cedri]|uniref:Cellular retinaldehyde binding/alpha-tocopherol transport,CRAL/TRIO, N-terminal domain,CRAL-TRIO lipid n=1 Tax=Cinara cedri TaxID=506608 RepID=A0A5E4N438_9HEMI|nr:Cellular retinaldehyde binding/alpha-tocopherol transport,CRAL/TRIO, N-terminal domain,CRAL-TRIO lipid [Cinara cedri]
MTLVQPTVEMQQHIRSELNEDLTTREKDLEHIKEWLQMQPHLPQFQDDVRLMTFLRGCKFSLEKTKRKLDMYFTMRAAVPEFFANRDPTLPEIKEVMKTVNVPPLPGLTPNGRRVVMLHGLDVDQISATVVDGMKVVLMIGDIRLKEEHIGVAGDVYILDACVATPQNFAAHFAKFTPTLLRKFLTCVQEAYPVKLKEVHVINASSLVDTIINFVKPFLKEKIRNRIHVHSNVETLYEYVPKDMLPEEYGGQAGPIAEINRQWYEKLVTYKDWFKDQEKIKTDESRRPGKPKTNDDLFGMEGSFKQLSID